MNLKIGICILIMSSLLFGQSRRVPDKTMALSRWIRHVGLHYLELVDETRGTDRALYAKLLDEKEAGLEIDAKGNDRIFVATALKPIRDLAEALNVAEINGLRDTSEEYRVRLHQFIHCSVDARDAIRAGEVKPHQFDECSFEATIPEIEAAKAADREAEKKSQNARREHAEWVQREREADHQRLMRGEAPLHPCTPAYAVPAGDVPDFPCK